MAQATTIQQEPIRRETVEQAVQVMLNCGYKAIAYRGFDFFDTMQNGASALIREDAAARLRNWLDGVQELVELELAAREMAAQYAAEHATAQQH